MTNKILFKTVRVEIIKKSILSVMVEIPNDMDPSDFTDEIDAKSINWDAFEKDAYREMTTLVTSETSLKEYIFTKEKFLNRYFPINE